VGLAPLNLDTRVKISEAREMQLLAQEEYGLRCLLALSRHDGDGPLTIHEIAGAEGLSADYAAKLLRALRRGGLVTSTRGAAGGYELARPAAEITVWDAIQVLGGSLFPEGFCACHGGRLEGCVRRSDCALRALWRLLDGAIERVLAGISLADLARSEPAMEAWLAQRPTRVERRLP
jgi:Rrf2 family protein